MESGQGAMSGGASSPTTSARPGTGSSYKRKRSGAEFESSPGSAGDDNDDEGERRRQPGVKRACNECRQQKVSQKRRDGERNSRTRYQLEVFENRTN